MHWKDYRKGVVQWAVMLLGGILYTSAYPADPESIFQAATGYTVKIRSVIETPFAEDEQGAFQAAGFVVDTERRWLVTNAHVAGHSPARIQAAFKGERFFPVEKIYVDPYLDIAVLRATDKDFPKDAVSAPLECQAIPTAGHPVGAFGHPWSLSYTGTRGIVSGTTSRYGSEWLQTDAQPFKGGQLAAQRNRLILCYLAWSNLGSSREAGYRGQAQVIDFQRCILAPLKGWTDAPLNTGNSGGPLISLLTGRVVAVNTAILDKAETESLNFAVAMKYVCRILTLLRQGKDPSPPALPMTFVNDTDDRQQLIVAASYFDQSESLQEGDIIQAIAGIAEPVRNETELVHLLRGRLGKVSLVVRRDGRKETVPLILSPQPRVVERQGLYVSGLLLAQKTFRDRPESRIAETLMVHSIEAGSLAASEALAPWSFLKSVDGKPFDKLDSLYGYLQEAAQQGRPVRLMLKFWSDLDDRLYEYRQCELPVEGLKLIGADELPNAERVTRHTDNPQQDWHH